MSPLYVRSFGQAVGMLTTGVTQVTLTMLQGPRRPVSENRSTAPTLIRVGAVCCGDTKSPGRRSGRGSSESDQETRTFSAWGPLGPWARSNSTFWFSSRDL